MKAPEKHVAAAGRTGRDRPPTGPRASRPGSAATARPVGVVLSELSRVRVRYEDLRSNGQVRVETVQLRTRLHELRAEAATARLMDLRS